MVSFMNSWQGSSFATKHLNLYSSSSSSSYCSTLLLFLLKLNSWLQAPNKLSPESLLFFILLFLLTFFLLRGATDSFSSSLETMTILSGWSISTLISGAIGPSLFYTMCSLNLLNLKGQSSGLTIFWLFLKIGDLTARFLNYPNWSCFFTISLTYVSCSCC